MRTLQATCWRHAWRSSIRRSSYCSTLPKRRMLLILRRASAVPGSRPRNRCCVKSAHQATNAETGVSFICILDGELLWHRHLRPTGNLVSLATTSDIAAADAIGICVSSPKTIRNSSRSSLPSSWAYLKHVCEVDSRTALACSFKTRESDGADSCASRAQRNCENNDIASFGGFDLCRGPA